MNLGFTGNLVVSNLILKKFISKENDANDDVILTDDFIIFNLDTVYFD